MPPHISIIIPTKNAGKRLDPVLAAVFSNKVNFEIEVIIIDSGSSDETMDAISRYPLKLIEMPPCSFSHGGARNLGADNAKGEYLVFLSQDAIPRSEDWLSNLIKNFDDDSVAGVYGRQVPNADSFPIEKFFLWYLFPDSKTVKDLVNPADCLLTDVFFSDVNSAIRKSDWEANRFNERLIMSEDQDWAKRVLLKGKKIVYEPAAEVAHSHRYTMCQLLRRNFDSGVSLKGIVNAPFARSVDYETRYLKNGVMFLWRNRSYASIFIFPLYESIRLFGFTLGFHARYLPLPVKKFLSQNKVYWQSAKQEGLFGK